MDGKRAFAAARYIRNIKGAVEVEKGQATSIEGLKKIDDFTLEMTMTERGNPGFYFYNGPTAIYPAGEADKESFLQKPIGLGPYKFVEHVPGSRLGAERWEKFYKPGMPYADRVVISIMGEAPARDVAFRNKEIDMSVLGPAQYVAYREDPNLKNGILEVAEVFTRHMGMNPEFKPFSDKRVRQAINHAIDTDLIIKRLVKDKAYRATAWLPLTCRLRQARASPTRSTRRGEEAARRCRLQGRLRVRMDHQPERELGPAIVEAVIPMLAKVGIKVKVKQVEVSVLIDAIRKGEPSGLILSARARPALCAEVLPLGDADDRLQLFPLKNPEFRASSGSGGADRRQRAASLLLQKADSIYDEGAGLVLQHNKAVMAYQPWIKGLQANATELTHQYPEYIWVDESSPAK
jgi:peptide/nickel transport system substrate-binding protein